MIISRMHHFVIELNNENTVIIGGNDKKGRTYKRNRRFYLQ